MNEYSISGHLLKNKYVVLFCGITAGLISNTIWIGIMASATCIIILMVPMWTKYIRAKKAVSLEEICNILKKKGHSSELGENEIHISERGKNNILKIQNNCQLEISREYDILSSKPMIECSEKAALRTMKEVHLAKVSVNEENGVSRLVFSTQSLYTSPKEIIAYLPDYLKILDFAENRQEINFREINSEANNRRIGFVFYENK